jgi:predicted O-methyltransferase YrrM
MQLVGESDGVIFMAMEEVVREFDVSVGKGIAKVGPKERRPQRRVVRPVAIFEVSTPAGAYPEINISMGRIAFEREQGDAREYRAFSRDEGRRLQAVYLGMDRPGDDDPRFFNGVFDHFLGMLSADRLGWLPEAALGADRNGIGDRLEFLHYHAHGWLQIIEMQLLDLMTRCSACNDAHVIEIGSYQGRSTAVIAAALGDRQVDSLIFSLDPNEISAQQADVAMANVAAVDQRRRLVQIHRGAEQAGHLLADGIAHLAFIDGRHEYEYVLNDFQLCDRLLRPQGILVFHDVYSPAHLGYDPAHTGPAQVIDEAVLGSGRYRPLVGAHLMVAMQKTT